jgi:hypothetical protein
MQILNNLDLTLNEVRNAVAEKLNAHPDPTTARFYFNSTDHKFYGHNGTEWVDLTNNGWRPAVDTFTDLELLSNLEDGLAVYVTDEDKLYTWDAPTSSWILPNISKDQLYDYEIPDVEEGDADKVVVINDSEDGVKYVPRRGLTTEYSNFNKIATQSIAGATPTLITWSPQNDVHGFWETGANTRITIPLGITKVRLSCLLNMQNIRRDRQFYVELLLNGGVIENSEYGTFVDSDKYISLNSRIIDVSENNYLQLRVYQNSGGARNILTANTYLQVEVLG